MKRLICWLRGHKRIRRLDRVDLTAVDTNGNPAFRVLDAVEYCGRCGRSPL